MIFAVLKSGALLVGALKGVQAAWLGPRKLTFRERQLRIDADLVAMAIEYQQSMERFIDLHMGGVALEGGVARVQAEVGRS